MPEGPLPEEGSQSLGQEELDAARDQLRTYRELIEEIPEIYEQKFRDRLQPILERNHALIEEGRLLQEQIAKALPQAGNPAALPGGSSGRPGRWLALARWLALGGLPLLALITGPVLLPLLKPKPRPIQGQRVESPAPARATPPAAPAARDPGPASGELLVQASGPSWMEVQTAQGSTLFLGTLSGSRTFPLDKGLKISAGRPDLVTVRLHDEPGKKLGTITEIGWHAFPAQRSADGEVSPSPAAGP